MKFLTVFLICLVGMMLVGGLFVATAHSDCNRAVQVREDGRAVWLYLVARQPERRDDPDVVEFVEFLDNRLPPLQCGGLFSTNPSPKE